VKVHDLCKGYAAMERYNHIYGPKFLLLAVALLCAATSVSANGTVKKTYGSAPVHIRQSSEIARSSKKNIRQPVPLKKSNLLNELLKQDSSLLSELERN
jgi:hypothetical protein